MMHLLITKKLLILIGVTYIWPPTLKKLAMLALYHRINPFNRFRAVIYVVAVATCAYTIVLTVLLTGPCNPIRFGTGTCFNGILMSQAVMNISFDMIIIIIPLPMIHKLQIPLRRKVVIGAIFAIGFI
jgi:hypothetical protein